MDLHTPIQEIGRLNKAYVARLEKLEIQTVGDLLFHIPFRYDDYSLISKISQVQAGEVVTIRGTVQEIKNEFTKNWKRLQKAIISDGTKSIEAIWFNQPYLTKIIHKGDSISLAGKIIWFSRSLVIESPEYEIITQKNTEQNANTNTIHTGRLVPVYPETKGVTSKWLRRQTYSLIKNNIHKLPEYLPYSIIKDEALFDVSNAIEQIHFPKTLDSAYKARQRLAFDELFLLQMASLQRRVEWENNLQGLAFQIDAYKNNIENFWKSLPFELTNAQQKAVHDIFNDLSLTKPMNRLLEGDVGSGKTVVATIAMYVAHLNGYQSVLMAPTEILAQQHYATISKLLEPLEVTVGLRTGSSKYQVASSKEKKIKNILNTKYLILNTDILVGTHAVLSEKINFEKLGLVVIDEQQRFGVEQRAIIREKGKNPHLLTMTATPIPRTVALTLYGDLDLSYLDEMPTGRKLIKTWLTPEEKRNNAYEWIQKQILETNSQAFIICPFIEESENMQTVKAATKEFERLSKSVFPQLSLGMLHGRMKGKEKDTVLEQFRNKEFHILVATPVVEVGIDIQNATIIVIEAAERFGLAQLHQLRGRVGRGNKQSYCLLFTDSKNPQTIQRLKAMETSNVGAELAELDLRLRGPGDMYGTAQHGTKRLKIASFSDFALIEKTRREAERIFPKLAEFPALQTKIKEVTIKTISPD